MILALILTIVWKQFEWTAPCDPPGCKRCAYYEARRLDVSGTGWVVVPVLTGPGAGSQVVPAIPGTVQQGYMPVDNSEAQWRRGGTEFALIAIDSSNNRSDYSNRVLGAEVVERDTTFMIKRSGYTSWSDPKSGHSLWWQLPFGDTGYMRIDHLETVNRYEEANVCRLFGHWLLRGQIQPCPVPSIPR